MGCGRRPLRRRVARSPAQPGGFRAARRRDRGQPAAPEAPAALDAREAARRAADRDWERRQRRHQPGKRGALRALHAARASRGYSQADRGLCALLPALPAGVPRSWLPERVLQRPGRGGDRRPAGSARDGRSGETEPSQGFLRLRRSRAGIPVGGAEDADPHRPAQCGDGEGEAARDSQGARGPGGEEMQRADRPNWCGHLRR